MYEGENTAVISHPWAEEELNYRITAKVFDSKDTKKFNGDTSVLKGEAIKTINIGTFYLYRR
ncbi:hypothetical protein [Sporosarcina sp. E16_8]|uniref:hypothetical protein n=1 Tax=Sporosarcina sp. E16_8 TaxID=2789295 RepID=UPI001A927057|nr:hypothetical protein [Sporosarcina sp. E16_8]MBO0589142.1 hypothetical protein [Sporosarcina sp. E16_8]